MIDFWTLVLTGFASGIGNGLSSWLILKRLEHVESKIKDRVKNNGK